MPPDYSVMFWISAGSGPRIWMPFTGTPVADSNSYATRI
jgi:hypothetical protein